MLFYVRMVHFFAVFNELILINCAVFSPAQLFTIPWTVAHQGPLYMEISRQEYWSRLPFPTPEIFLAQRSNLHFLHFLNWQADSLPLCHLGIGDWYIEWGKLLSPVQLFATPWTVTRQAPLFIGFSRQEYQSRLPFPSPGDLPNPGIEPRCGQILYPLSHQGSMQLIHHVQLKSLIRFLW